jgi:hypothetical protein
MGARTSILLILIALGFGPGAAADDKTVLDGPVLIAVGAQRAGNAEGTIPAWSGGMDKSPAGFTGSKSVDPYADDPVLFTINAANAHEYASQLSPRQQALLAAFPDSWHTNIYRSRRSAAYPEFVYDAIQSNPIHKVPS